jgi:hypothetical protein
MGVYKDEVDMECTHKNENDRRLERVEYTSA